MQFFITKLKEKQRYNQENKKLFPKNRTNSTQKEMNVLRIFKICKKKNISQSTLTATARARVCLVPRRICHK